MQRITVRLAALVALLLGVAAFGQPTAGTKKEATDRKEELKPAAGSLEDLIAQALRNNPDIRVAEAKLREAEAELQRARVAAGQKVAGLYHSIDIARKAVAEAQQRFVTVNALRQRKAASDEDLRAAEFAQERAIAELAKLQAEMPALLGKMPGKPGQKAEADSDARTQQAVAAGISWLRYRDLAGSTWRTDSETATSLALSSFLSAVGQKAGPEGSIADKIRKTLDTPIKADFRNKSIESVIDELRKHLGVTLHAPRLSAQSIGPDFDLGEVPLGVAIQALTDLFPHTHFVVRDYGILYTSRDALPPGAIELYDFWKSGAGKSESEAKNPPASGYIQGTVSEVDAKSGLVRIHTSGGQEGLAKGHTLEVYRESPKPMYLGTLQIIDVASTSAVGKVVGKSREPIMKGDKVTSKLDGK